jgi:oligopeptide/dipeptide ABC transporter ATP-binding protein
MDDQPIIEVTNLHTRFRAPFGTVRAVDGVSFHLNRGETLGIVGESGSGKSVTALSMMRLVAPPGKIVSGQVMFDGQDLLDLPNEAMRRLRGNRIGMVFQNPMTALNPALRIGWQLEEAVLAHDKGTRQEARAKALRRLEEVGISDVERRANSYPHEYSGGMRQRIVLAMGMINEPDVLIADEPTTALDVTIQAQVLELMKRLTREHGMALILITHDMGVVANMCDRVAVMYAGQIVEQGPATELFHDPRHPYTWALLKSMPHMDVMADRLSAIGGHPPDMTDPPSGCRFRDRCPFAEPICHDPPELDELEPRRYSRCWVAQRGEHFAGRDDALLTQAGGNA